MCRPAKKPFLRGLEGDDYPADLVWPGADTPPPKLEDRFPPDEVAKLRAKQQLAQKK